MAKRQFNRRKRAPEKLRDARLIIIAAEGTKTEVQYFKALTSHDKYRSSRIRVEVLEREDLASSPSRVIKQLNQFRKTYDLDANDELWLVIDVDSWLERELSDVAQQCEQKNYFLAVSNPCFELWLLLHLKSLEDYKENKIQDLFENKKSGSRTAIEIELKNLLGTYSKKNIATEKFLPHVEQAIDRAKNLDKDPSHRWTNEIGTRVYLLVESIIDKLE